MGDGLVEARPRRGERLGGEARGEELDEGLLPGRILVQFDELVVGLLVDDFGKGEGLGAPGFRESGISLGISLG